MKAQLLTTATFMWVLSGALSAADSQLLNLVMPDAKVLAGVNVQQAKGTQFGQYVLTQTQSADHDMQHLADLTGFDPTRDVVETLVATNGAPNTGLAVARGNFDIGKISMAASAKGAISEDYNGVTILEEPKQTHGLAFLDSTTAVAGDIASVKGAIDRQKNPQPLSSAVTAAINQLSGTQDAWALCTVPPASLAPPANANAQIPAALQTVQSASGGVKFGGNVVFTGQAQTDTPDNATALRDLVKFMINLAQMNAGQNAQAAALAQLTQVSASGNVVSVSLSLPQDQFQQLARFGQKSGVVQGRRGAVHQNPERK